MEGIEDEVGALVVAVTGADSIAGGQPVQTLWGGYGQIVRCELDGGAAPSVIVKHVRWPSQPDHPYGWNSDASHERKVRSYQVEAAWYEHYASRCSDEARVPRCLGVTARDEQMIIVLEDLDAAGYAGRRQRVGDHELDACLHWLAEFHASFMGVRPDALWPTGTYWHLATRRDEFDALPDGPLRRGAAAIDQMLTRSDFQTLVHGDAKLANFCFSSDGTRAAAVDFQYVGGGCGMKDLAYFVGSCLDDDEAEARETAVLDRYFTHLGRALIATGSAVDITDVEAEWRPLYPVAWTDFARFLQGWSPGHWKLHRYTEHLAAGVLDSLDPRAES